MRLALGMGLFTLGSVALAVLLPGLGERTNAQAIKAIEVGDLFFCDSKYQNDVCETTITAGDTIEWQFVGALAHTTTECGGNLDTCPEPHLWDSGVRNAGAFAVSFDSPGTYVYRCQLHPVLMRGRITVEPAPQPSPSPSPTAAPSPSPTAAPSPSPPASPEAPASPTGPTPPAGLLPSGGSAPPDGSSAALPWWLAVAAGAGLLAAAAISVRSMR